MSTQGQRGKSFVGSICVILIGAFLVYLGGRLLDHEPKKKKAATLTIDSMGLLILETNFKWSKVVGFILKIAATALEIEWILGDGDEEREKVELPAGHGGSLKPGTVITIRDKDGVEKRYELKELEGKHLPASEIKGYLVKYRCKTEITARLRHSGGRELLDLFDELNIPWQTKKFTKSHLTVRYGPVLTWQSKSLPNFNGAKTLAEKLEKAEFEIVMK